jgi:hypothetical protein
MKPSLTSEAIGPAGKNGKPLPYENSDRVKDDDGDSFGKSRVSYAFDRKMMMRRIARKRRSKYLMRLSVPIALHPRRIEVFEPAVGEARELGIRSYKVEMTDASNTMSGPVRTLGRKISISLPFVSILRSRLEQGKGE